ncbi:MAG: hypothetical protein GEV07_22995 [Streptosporangiales bacterium]|nr:hypothetical protein [Streptosporangiales bacterium]
MPPRQEDPTPTSHTNIAGDHATVGAQIGINNGTVVHTRHVYIGGLGDSPQERLRRAIGALETDPPRAQAQLRELLEAGQYSTQLAYYYTLSLLSGLPLHDIGQVRAALKGVRPTDQQPTDEWSAALHVIWRYLDCISQGAGERFDRKNLDRAQQQLEGLHRERRWEIAQHVGNVIDGAGQDRADDIIANQVPAWRMANDRAGRAWKFFEDVPAKSRQEHQERTTIRLGIWGRILAGGIPLPFALAAPFSPLGSGRLAVGIPALVMFLAGVLAAGRFGAQRATQRMRLERRDSEHGIPLNVQPPVSPGHWVRTRFVEDIHRWVDEWFTASRPHTEGQWSEDTRGIREYLKGRFVSLYGNAHVTAGQVDWLIRWHAKRVAQRWRTGKLFAYREELRPSRDTATFYYLSVAVALIGVVMMLGAGGGFAATAVLLGIGPLQAMQAVTVVIATRRCDSEARILSAQLAREEKDAHTEWQQLLRDQPDDTELARWLNLDKSFLWAKACEQYALKSRDVLSYAVLTEGRSAAGRAREVRGPWRYKSYRVLVFLLTRSGMREADFELDFVTGNARFVRRMSFRYDVLASARVSEYGVRYRGDRPRTQQNFVHRSTFRLSLLSGEEIKVRTQGFTDTMDSQLEDELELQQTELVASGISAALQLLEAVTAEGRDWISQQQQRRRIGIAHWRRQRVAPTAGEPDDPFE